MRTVMACCVTVLVATAAPRIWAQQPGEPRAAQVGDALRDAMRRHELPAMGAAIVEADGTLTALEVAGVRA
ncbi:MAG: hypothetical protein ACF8R7_06630, partial [Phycisphaerales bacterium JB039]